LLGNDGRSEGLDTTMALQIDIAAAVALWQWRAELAREASHQRG
jgi:hypothetical protein